MAMSAATRRRRARRGRRVRGQASLAMERRLQIGPRCLDGGDQTEQKGGGERKRHREPKRPAVDVRSRRAATPLTAPVRRAQGRRRADEQAERPPATRARRSRPAAAGRSGAAGAERRPQRQVASRAGDAREQQAGDVGAGDQQNEADRAHQDAKRRPHRSGQLDRAAARPPSSRARSRPGARRAAGLHGIEVGARSLESDAGFQPAERLQVLAVTARIGQRRLVADRRPHLRACVESLRNAAARTTPAGRRRCEGHAVQGDERPTTAGSPANDRRHSPSLSITTCQPAGVSSAGVKSRPSAGSTPSMRKKFADTRMPATVGSPFAIGSASRIGSRPFREAAAAAAPVEEGRVTDVAGLAVRPPLADRCTSRSGVGIGQRSQQHGVHDAEDRGVGADAERQRDQRDGREARRADEQARGVAYVTQQVGSRREPVAGGAGQRGHAADRRARFRGRCALDRRVAPAPAASPRRRRCRRGEVGKVLRDMLRELVDDIGAARADRAEAGRAVRGRVDCQSGMADAGDAVERREERAPAAALRVEDLAAGGGQAVEAPAPHAGLFDPASLDQPAALEPIERRVERSDVEGNGALGSVANQLGDLVAVAVALLEQRQDQGFGAAFAQLAVGGHMTAAYVSVIYMSTARFERQVRVHVRQDSASVRHVVRTIIADACRVPHRRHPVSRVRWLRKSPGFTPGRGRVAGDRHRLQHRALRDRRRRAVQAAAGRRARAGWSTCSPAIPPARSRSAPRRTPTTRT